MIAVTLIRKLIGVRGIVTKCYDLYFGLCDHIGVRWCSKCLYNVIMCRGPLGDVLSIGVLCSVYKARCCRSSGLGKSKCLTHVAQGVSYHC